MLLSTLASICLIFIYILIIGAACEGKPASGADDSDNKGIKCEGKPASADDDSDISDNEGKKSGFAS